MVSADKLTEITIRTVDGEPAPAFDTFVWGWGGDPYDPSFLLSLFLTDQIGGNSDSFYSNPEYDRLFNEQAGAFDVAERKEVMAEMVNLTQEDLPYIVLTEDPNLQAYRTDRLSNVEQTCPADETGDLFCEQISYEPLLSLTPADSSSDSGDGGGSGVVIAVIAAAVVAVAGFLFLARAAGARASRWSSRNEARFVNLRWLAGKTAAALLTLAFVIVFNFFLFRVMGDPTNQLARVPNATQAEIDDLRRDYGLDKPLLTGQFVDYLGDTATLDLGTSQRSRRSVWTEIKEALPWTLLLVGTGTLLATLIGSWMGVVAATRRGKKTDDSLLGFSLFTYAAPEYWIGIILILVFAVWIPVLPAGLQMQAARPPRTGDDRSRRAGESASGSLGHRAGDRVLRGARAPRAIRAQPPQGARLPRGDRRGARRRP